MILKSTFIFLILGGVAYTESRSVYGQSSQFYTEATAIYWKTWVNGLGYAIESTPSGKVYNPDFRWGVGFHVGLGYRVPHDAWKITLEWISYRTHCTNSIHPSNNSVLFPLWTLPFQQVQEGFMQAEQHYRLHLGLVDLLLSKRLSVSDHIYLTPDWGLSFGSVRQKYHLTYFQEDPVSWRMKNKFEGLGPYLGCLGEVALLKGFSLFGKASIRFLYGRFYTHQGQRLEKTDTKNLRLFNRFDSLAPVAAGTLGLRWQSPVLYDHQQWKIEIAYDQMLLFAQNQLPHLMQNAEVILNQGDLSLLGVHLTGGFSF